MATRRQPGKAWLLANAKAVAKQLSQQSDGTGLRIRTPYRVSATLTDGWHAVIGDMGKDKPRLEIWFDRFTKHPDRKLYACFDAMTNAAIAGITKHVSKKLWPVRELTDDHINDDGKHTVLNKRLLRTLFNVPLRENYAEVGEYYYSFFDKTNNATKGISESFVEKAVAFFLDVAQAMPHAKASIESHHEDFPKTENRKTVISHIHRERNRTIAIMRKELDKYKCQVCGLKFDEVYGGELGHKFAEAHHIVPLSRLKENVQTDMKDLRTVCANCHRMLHRMDGKAGDMVQLKHIYLNQRKLNQ
jgi:predicted HNH restriction endonuclease